MAVKDNTTELWEQARDARAAVEVIWAEIAPPGTSVTPDQIRRLVAAKAVRDAAEERWRKALAARSVGQ